MAEYIDRKTTMDAVNRLVDMTGDAGREKGLRAAVSVLSRLDAADVAPVRHGRWSENGSGILVCSECQRAYNLVAIYTHYCPNCGAKMDGEAQ